MKTHLHLFATLLIATIITTANATEFEAEGLIVNPTEGNCVSIVGCADTDLLEIHIPYSITTVTDGTTKTWFVDRVAANALVSSRMTTLILDAAEIDSPRELIIENRAFDTETLREVIIERLDMPIVEGEPFSNTTLDEGTISFGADVPNSTKEIYLAEEPWNLFAWNDKNRGVSTTVDSRYGNNGREATTCYTLQGARTNKSAAGLKIVCDAKGARKVIR